MQLELLSSSQFCSLFVGAQIPVPTRCIVRVARVCVGIDFG